MKSIFLIIPFLVQAAVIFADEFYFHIKRGLPKWERLGHPLDTLSLLACFVFVYVTPYSGGALKWYIALAILSCLFVTKDEFVHKHVCNTKEMWLHALLFINHPIVLTALGLLWPVIHNSPSLVLTELSTTALFLRMFVLGQAVLVSLFFLYQVIYWNFIWKEKKASL